MWTTSSGGVRERTLKATTRVRRHCEPLHGLRPVEAVFGEVLGERDRELLELVQACVDEPALERRDDDEVRGAERPGDDRHEHEGDPGPDTAGQPHSDLKR